MRLPDALRIATASSIIDPVFLDTPAYQPEGLASHLGLDVMFKDERATPIRSFKGRGADLLVQSYDPGTEFVCASAGNFGQGMAWAVRRRGGKLIVFAATTAVACKVEAMRSLGGTVILEGSDFDAAKQAAKEYAHSTGKLFVEDGAQVEIAEGAGTLAVELLQDPEPFDAIFIPLGNGSLAAGIGCWVKHQSPDTKVIAVAAQGAPAMGLAVLGRPFDTETCETIADGIAIRVPVPEAVQAVAAVADDVLFVSEEMIRQAIELVERTTGKEVEPAGAAGLAGLLSCGKAMRNKRVAIPICGGNRGPLP